MLHDTLFMLHCKFGKIGRFARVLLLVENPCNDVCSCIINKIMKNVVIVRTMLTGYLPVVQLNGSQSKSTTDYANEIR